MTYKTKGVCASHIEFEVDDNKKVHNVFQVLAADICQALKNANFSESCHHCH